MQKKSLVNYVYISFSFINIILIIGIISIIFSLSGCKSAKQTDFTTADEVYTAALKAYNENELIEAAKLFDIIKLQYPASLYSDDAQFYLAEINYKRSEYILSAFNYNMLRRIYPASEYAKEALYKTALCFYQLSPTYDRDQEYTFKAIEAFQEFQRVYPNDSLFTKASEFIRELRDKLGLRNYKIAELYRKIFSPKSALIYLDVLIDDYNDTKYFEPAVVMKAEILYEMSNFNELKKTIEFYKKNFPNGQNISKIKSYEN